MEAYSFLLVFLWLKELKKMKNKKDNVKAKGIIGLIVMSCTIIFPSNFYPEYLNNNYLLFLVLAIFLISAYYSGMWMFKLSQPKK